MFPAPSARAIIDTNLQMQLGNPTGATADTNNHNHFLLVRSIEAIDYNDNHGQPNWASWDLSDPDTGTVNRTDAWAEDTTLPASFYKVQPNDYSGSGFDRGHLCPSADRTDTIPHNEDTFIMSNLMPQTPQNNQGLWATFENYCRNTLMGTTGELLIITGPSGFTTNHISSNTHILIPSNTWKIVVVVPVGGGTALSRITTTTNRVISILVPNTTTVSSQWTNYITSAHDVELETGFSFFTALPGPIASAFRAKIDDVVNPPAPTISSFTPTSGTGGTNVVITGNNFLSASAVKFSGVSSVYIVDSNTQITAVVPTNAATGTISVTTPGGTVTSSGTFTVSSGSPDLSVTSSHAGNFTQGDIGVTYTLAVTNVGGAVSSGTLTVSNSLPAGLTATAFSGAGWTATLGTLTATRSDALAAGAAYPLLTLTLNVATNAAALVTNTVTLTGGGDTNTANNTFKDPTTINAAAAPVATTGSASSITTNTATLNGTVDPNGQPATAQFQYGLTTSYTLTSAVPGTVTGSTAQSVSVNISNLTTSTTYHFRVVATNSLGSSGGADQTFTTAALPTADLAVTKSHAGNFTRGDTADTYSIVITNVGNAASAGTVTVADVLPTGLTATAISGSGWTTDLPTLTATRSDALAAGAAYAVITVTVNVAANAPASVTNTATVSGGGDSSSGNNTNYDATTVIAAGGGTYTGTLMGWDTSGLTAAANGYGPSPFTPTTNAPNLTVVGLTRGSGVGTSGTAAGRAWGGTGFTNASSANAVGSNQFVTFSASANSGYVVSFSSVSRFDYRRSGTGATNGLLQYQIGAGAFVDIANVFYTNTTSAGSSLAAIDLSGISALQNVGAGTNVTFRIVNWGGTSSGGTWYVFDTAVSTALDFTVTGTVAQANHAPVAVADAYTRFKNSSLTIKISDLLTNDSDVDGNTLSLSSFTSPTTNNITLTTDNTNIFYPLNTNNNVNDRFTYTVSDGNGGTSNAFVNITVNTNWDALSLKLTAFSLTSTSRTVTFLGAPGLTYVVRAGTNIVASSNWPAMTTNAADNSGVFLFTDTQSSNYPMRFYRAFKQ